MSNTDPMPQFYAALGFSSNPFEGNTAEREPEIELYAVRPPYLDPVEAASKVTGSYTLAGMRGSGKSATRITVQRNIWKQNGAHPLPVALTNFSDFRGKKSPPELLDLYASQVFFLAIEGVLVYLTSIPSEEAEQKLRALDKLEKKFLDWSIKNYYLSRSDAVRNASAQECYELLSVSFARRSKLWADKKWGAITSGLVDITAGIAKRFDIDVGDVDSYKKIFAQDKQADATDPYFILRKAVE